MSASTHRPPGRLYLGFAGFLAILCEQLHAELPRTH
jgi:hypothetical protein